MSTDVNDQSSVISYISSYVKKSRACVDSIEDDISNDVWDSLSLVLDKKLLLNEIKSKTEKIDSLFENFSELVSELEQYVEEDESELALEIKTLKSDFFLINMKNIQFKKFHNIKEKELNSNADHSSIINNELSEYKDKLTYLRSSTQENIVVLQSIDVADEEYNKTEAVVEDGFKLINSTLANIAIVIQQLQNEGVNLAINPLASQLAEEEAQCNILKAQYDDWKGISLLDVDGINEDEVAVGSHLKILKTGYSHHGIYIGNGRVIHYSGLADGFESGPIEEASLEVFRKSDNKFTIVAHLEPRYLPEESVARAKSRIGESHYCLFSNNCEHFVNWAIEGDHQSTQVDYGTTGGSGLFSSGVGIGSRAAVAASGSVVGLSGSGIMSGLASVGGLVGGGAVAGVGILGGSGAISIATLINKTVLKDDSSLDYDERESRQVGRVASYAGAAAGTAGSIAAISGAGTVAGLSATGITSGLAAIGGTVGGGMAAGVVLTTAAPAAAAAAVGYGLYKAVKWWKK